MSTLVSQMASLKLSKVNDGVSGIFDLTTPCSTRPSSPVSETSSLEIESDTESEQVANAEAPIQIPQLTLLQTLVNAIVLAGKTRSPQETRLLNYLHLTPATPTDVQSIIPTLSHYPAVTDKLATNIAYYHACGAIPNASLDQILQHILAAGDAQQCLYESTKARLSYYCRRVPQHQRVKDMRRLEKQAEHRRQTMPAHLKERPGHKARPKDRMEVADSKASQPPSAESSLGGHFSRTRLHNGPGLSDRKRPKVCLPRNDTREVLTRVEDVAVVRDDRLEQHYLWAKTK
ncbi:hypothetical protein BDW02DRAFT_556906 [Decorospora gaudefroyi]|uniref:Uncharacterized protein n=1 Tax=Decorospora gaudefroyi TaxID=184978 RepID=A0A6A5K317_9PLEO|nr:hypothetical protein BDW02DRAFT_556906 [Decorospora gaudefroyi]